jgi:hypothetical protein
MLLSPIVSPSTLKIKTLIFCNKNLESIVSVVARQVLEKPDWIPGEDKYFIFSTKEGKAYSVTYPVDTRAISRKVKSQTEAFTAPQFRKWSLGR